MRLISIPCQTVEEKVRYFYEYDRVKHDLDYDTDDKINELTNSELLKRISDAIIDVIEEASRELP